MDELSIAYVYSPTYSPDLNPVEYIFSYAKQEIKKARLRAILNEEDINLGYVIEDSFNSVDCLKISNCVYHTH